jgi:hypothetical protein
MALATGTSRLQSSCRSCSLRRVFYRPQPLVQRSRAVAGNVQATVRAPASPVKIIIQGRRLAVSALRSSCRAAELVECTLLLLGRRLTAAAAAGF